MRHQGAFEHVHAILVELAGGAVQGQRDLVAGNAEARAPDAAQKLATLAKGSLAAAIDLVGMPASTHWEIYLPTMVFGMAAMVPFAS